MRVVISVNEEVSDYLEGGNGVSYESSLTLYQHFVDRGHEVYIVHPTETTIFEDKISFRRLLSIGDRKLSVISEDFEMDADVFLVRGLGEDSPDPDSSMSFIYALPLIERQVGVMLNDAESTSYEYKPKQKSLGLPFIPSFDVDVRDDIRQLLESGERIIAKPNIGFYGVGIEYLEGPEALSSFAGDTGGYSFERFMPEMVERRYIFLDGRLIVRRMMEREGPPGKERPGHMETLPSGEAEEERTAMRAMEMTGMFYGCVDFRQGHVLEINGSGTSTICAQNGKLLYDIGPSVVKAVEAKAASKA